MFEYGAVIDLDENGWTLRQPCPTPIGSMIKGAPVRVLAGHVNLLSQSSVLIAVVSGDASCLKVLL